MFYCLYSRLFKYIPFVLHCKGSGAMVGRMWVWAVVNVLVFYAVSRVLGGFEEVWGYFGALPRTVIIVENH